MFSSVLDRRYFSVLLILLVILVPVLRAEDLYFEQRDFSAITIPSVSDLTEDDRGYLWIGTPGGLLRYDGGKFLIVNRMSDSALPSDRVLSLEYDGNSDVIWIGTAAGLVRYNLSTDKMDPIRYRNDRYKELGYEVLDLEVYQDNVFAVTHNGIFQLVRGDSLEKLSVDPAGSDEFIEVAAAASDEVYGLWISTSDGLKKWDEDSGAFVHIVEIPGSGAISVIGDDVWFGGMNSDLYRYDTVSGDVDRFESTADISVILDGPDGLIWIGSTSDGLSTLDPLSGQIIRCETDPEHPNRLTSSRIESMLYGSSGHIWIGTSDSGLLSVDTGKNNHLKYIKRSGSDGLPPGSVNVIYEDSLGYIWTGSDIGGLARIDPYNGEVRQYSLKADNLFSVCGNSISDIAEDSSGRLWVGTENGPCMYLTEVDGFEPAGMMIGGWPDFSGKHVLALTSGSDGSIWMSFKNGELYRLNPQERDYSVFRFTPESVPSVLLTDRQGTLWAGSRKNVRIFNNEGNLLKTWQPVGVDAGGFQEGGINVIFEDSRGRIWLGTTAGVSVYKGFDTGFEALPFPDGKILNISDISEDQDGKLWVTDGRFINVFDSGGQFLTAMGGDVGLTPSGLITSLELSGDGTMYVGANGEIWTYDSHIESPPASHPKVYLTGLKVMNATWAAGHEMNSHSSFVLNSDEKVFSISFGSVDYRFQSENNYQYKLKGFSDDWVDLGKTDTVTFANLPPNHYVFNVRAINDLGQISDNQAEVEINIERPFWTTPLAIVFYAAVFLGLIVLFLKLWEGRLMKSQIQELEIARLKVLEANKRLSFLTMNDTLTGLLNRRGFDQGISHALNTAQRNGLMITLIMMDVDFFKLFNDNYGHVQGDEVLRKVGIVLRSVFERSTDIIARYGGEEFAVVFIGENPNASVTLANDLITAVREMGIPHKYSSVSDRLTLSAGSATISADEPLTVQNLISMADRALYNSKAGGRDRVCFTGIIPELPGLMKNELKPLVLETVSER